MKLPIERILLIAFKILLLITDCVSETTVATTSAPLDDQLDSDIEACFASLPDDRELPTTRKWWNATLESPYAELSSFFHSRNVFMPLENEETIIVGTLFTWSGNVLKLSAFFPPLFPQESRIASMQVQQSDGTIVATKSCHIRSQIWHCLFRVDNLPPPSASDEFMYEIQYKPDPNNSALIFTYNGFLPAPVDDPKIVAMGCFGLDGSNTQKESLVAAVHDNTPDLLVLQGDQTYYHGHLGFGFLNLLYSIHDLTRSTPTVVQMDDHDYGEGNLWGAGYASIDTSGAGFSKPVCLINALQELCMSHNPDRVNTGTLENGIDIYYSNYQYGRTDFAILEARKFKNKEKGTSLLGEDQEDWLEGWCSDSQYRRKIVLAQTPFAALGTHETVQSGGVKEITKPTNDPNGFPVAGRRRAMDIFQDCTHLIISGDQHLGIAVSYDDYNITECASPAAINTVWWRLNKWELNASHYDLHGNQYRLYAAWNVDEELVARFKKPGATVSMSEDIKEKRADGILIVQIEGERATCSAHSYRTSQSQIWSHSFSL